MPATSLAKVENNHKFLEISNSQLNQVELLGDDIDVDDFKIRIQNGFPTGVNIADRIINSPNISRTIQGGSTISVDIVDDTLEFWRSGAIRAKIDVELEGLWFRLRQITRNSGRTLTLTFEDREIAVLRTYTRRKIASRGSGMTRAQFILSLLQEVTEFVIPYYIPELTTPEPVYNANGAIVNPSPQQRQQGINPDETLTVKNVPATINQILIANAILLAGHGSIPANNSHKRKILICAMMTAIQESTLNNSPPGSAEDGSDSQGVFQQRPSQGWPNTMNVTLEANAFFARAVEDDALHPEYTYGELCQAVQRSAFPNAYTPHRTEATDFVDAFGATGGDGIQPATGSNGQAAYTTADSGFYFYRGIPPSRKHQGWKPESSWTCIQRLAQEVNWRAFFVSGTFYYVSDDWLMKSMPRAIISSDSDGVDDITGDFDVNKKVATVEVLTRAGKFVIPPGSVIKFINEGVFNGRWIVDTISRNLNDTQLTIECDKPQPVLLEPAKNNLPANALPSAQKNKFSDPQQNPNGTAYWHLPSDGFSKPNFPDITSAATQAQKILDYATAGQYRDDNPPNQMNQWRKVVDGKTLTNQCKNSVSLNPKVPEVITYLLDNGYKVGTFSICEDHGCPDVPGDSSMVGHSGGQAIDISSIGIDKFMPINGAGLNAADIVVMTEYVKRIMLAIRDAFNPSQIICNGTAMLPNPEIADIQWNNGKQVSYITTDHLNHVHVGF